MQFALECGTHMLLQDVCAHYWPAKDIVCFGEFFVEFLEETEHQNYVERKFLISWEVRKLVHFLTRYIETVAFL